MSERRRELERWAFRSGLAGIKPQRPNKLLQVLWPACLFLTWMISWKRRHAGRQGQSWPGAESGGNTPELTAHPWILPPVLHNDAIQPRTKLSPYPASVLSSCIYSLQPKSNFNFQMTFRMRPPPLTQLHALHTYYVLGHTQAPETGSKRASTGPGHSTSASPGRCH